MTSALVNCECSARVRDALRAVGVDAWSCDLEPCEGDPAYHIQGDALDAMRSRPWDMMIAHPPCTYLANSGARWLAERAARWRLMEQGAAFFRAMLDADIPRIAVENPQPHKWAAQLIGKPAFCLQPWEHGDRQKKRTCFWLKNLPPLLPSEVVGPPPIGDKSWEAVWREPPGPNQKRNRSRTFPGIARAIASQWGTLPPLTP